MSDSPHLDKRCGSCARFVRVIEKIDDVSTRTTYAVALNQLSVITERSTNGSEWVVVLEGSYKRPRG